MVPDRPFAHAELSGDLDLGPALALQDSRFQHTMLLVHRGSPLVGVVLVTTIVPGVSPLFVDRNRQVLVGEFRQFSIGDDKKG